MLNGSLPEVVRMAAEGRLGDARMKLFHALGFMLASPVDSVEEALSRFAQEIEAEHAGVSAALPPAEQHAEDAAAQPPMPEMDRRQQAVHEAQMEDKYDGIRAQLHCGDPQQPGRVVLFSRNREDITESFPNWLRPSRKWPSRPSSMERSLPGSLHLDEPCRFPRCNSALAASG